VAVTAHAMDGDRERCIDAGMDDHLTKPFSRANLIDMVERWAKPPSADSASEVAEEAVVDPGAEVADPEATESSALDPAALDQLGAIPGADKSGLISRVISLYLETSYPIGVVIREAAERGDADDLASSAHRLKSSSAEVGAVRLAELCKKLEVMGRTSELAEALATAAELVDELEEVRRALESRIA
jgi:two-component system sensor histidine kinase/response regulator